MKELTAAIKQLASEELARANEKFPQFASSHEGYAIVKEEFEEAAEEIGYIGQLLNFLWNQIKANGEVVGVEALEKHAIQLAAEAVQIAAMCAKFKHLSEKEDGRSDNESKNY